LAGIEVSACAREFCLRLLVNNAQDTCRGYPLGYYPGIFFGQ